MSASAPSPTSARPIDLVIFLHGVGSGGADLEPLARAWARVFGFAVAAPDAPHAFDMAAMGRQWFSVAGVTEANRADRVAAAAPAFDAVVDAAIARAGTVPERTALVGFSQGTIMALDALARGRSFAAVLGFSGRMARPPAGALDDAIVALIHGTADTVIPVEESSKARERLEAAGATASFVAIPGAGHGIGPTAEAAGRGFLAEVMGRDSA
jgi:phospholipase/carboxylesterase